jgi:UDP-N-acetylmuramate dehydrogenase
MGVLLSDLRADLARVVGPANVRIEERLSRYTSWRVGGAAELLCVAENAVALERAALLLRGAGVPWLVLGRGSNVLVDDAGVAGVVIMNRAAGLRITGGCAHAESGVLLSVLARRTAAAGLAGLEWCHDIPGTVGGAVVNNAGANGGTMADVLRSVRLLCSGGVREVDASDLQFGYRSSALRSEGRVPAGSWPLVLKARFGLAAGVAAELQRCIDSYRTRRKATQPTGASAGSVFKNPTGDSAGRLVESVGLKGTRIGEAEISRLHANFVLAGPRARAGDIVSLISLARHRVWEECGVLLEPEIQYLSHDMAIGPPPEGI